MTAAQDDANDFAARYAHGHDDRLVEGCALCNAEYDAVVALSQQAREERGERCCCPNPETSQSM